MSVDIFKSFNNLNPNPMRIRKTSIESYLHNFRIDLTGQMHRLIVKTLLKHGDMTARELFRKKGLQTNQSGRFTELREMGLIVEKGKKVCSVTGRNAILWGAKSL